MTEVYEDGNYLVRVRAQVMTRDDSSGGWVPLGGGGLSNVSVRKRITTTTSSLINNQTAHKNNNNKKHSSSSIKSSNGSTNGSGGGTAVTTKVVLHRNGGSIYNEPLPATPTSPGYVAPPHRRHLSSGEYTEKINNNAAGQPAVAKHEYFIFGKRISDQSIVLSCTIKKDFEYNKVMPTFHHWRTEDKKFGLTFQTAADARAFDKGVRTAVEDLLDGLAGSYPSSPIYKYSKEKDLGEEDVFMSLNLPIDIEQVTTAADSDLSDRSRSQIIKESRQQSTQQQQPIMASLSSSRDVITQPPPSSQHQHIVGMAPHHPIHRIHYSPLSSESTQSSKDKGESYSYVQLTAVHDYIYPHVEDSKSIRSITQHQQSIESLKKHQLELMPQLSILQPSKASPPPTTPTTLTTTSKYKKPIPKNVRIRCRYCNEYYAADDNPKGCCEFAPDGMKSGIEKIACMNCAQCMVYHCMSDAEGDFATQPCACNTFDRGCVKRWIGVTLLSLFVPCLWCYPPLRACHKCLVCCQCCGGQHSPATDE